MILTDKITGQRLSGVWCNADDSLQYGHCSYCGAEDGQQCSGELHGGTTIEVATKVHVGRETK